jgi:probable addiction module antidote protein
LIFFHTFLSAQWARQICPALFVGRRCLKMIAKQSIRSSRTSRSKIAERINAALETGDIVEICQAIGAATRQYNMSDLARRAGLERPTLYRAFEGGEKRPNFTTVINVLRAMGFELSVVTGQNAHERKPTAKERHTPGAVDLD